ncbi:MAG: (d)CMP kinase [Firmicutes bacterium]|jgi:cytidylate kinase|nr:(d)CMP kinase [Bacillota bacterium]MBQ2083709.1 (d)CMP kinase [Bacillota bacterium]MBR3394595.1 (d)CMP kinase [Bacillota bacterium]
MRTKTIVAIDGPAGAGKSTIAKRLAQRIGADYIDTGAMYRAVALKLLRTGTDYNDPEALQTMLDAMDVDFSQGKTILDGEDVSGLIRTPEISALASPSSGVPAVRYKLTALQQAMGKRKSIVMDGRDIGTVVFPDADFKFFLTASADERARRRTEEMRAKGQEADFETIRADIIQRDYQDSHRAFRPLQKAEDAVEIDSTDMSIDSVVDTMMAFIEARDR